MKELENYKICHLCGGKCCKKSGCDYFVSDFETLNLEYLIDLLDTGNVSIVAALHFNRLNTGKMYAYPFLYLRARNYNRDVVDLFSMKTRCSMLTDEGCSYDFEHRPGGGCALVPRESYRCMSSVNQVEEIRKWEPYQKVLSKLVKRYSGLSVDSKLSCDMEKFFYDILNDNTEGVSKEELKDITSNLVNLIKCFPNEYESANKRSKNFNVLVRR